MIPTLVQQIRACAASAAGDAAGAVVGSALVAERDRAVLAALALGPARIGILCARCQGLTKAQIYSAIDRLQRRGVVRASPGLGKGRQRIYALGRGA